MYSRRRFTAILCVVVALQAFSAACRARVGAESRDGRLAARPGVTVATTATGTERLEIGGRRDALLRLPSAAAEGPLPLIVLLHGAGGSGEGILRRVGSAADAAGVAVLAPDSRDSTWDAIRSGFGADIAFLDRALARTFERVAIDPARVAVGGFSDGASYALSLGAINGDLFRKVVAFSPGFMVGGATNGRPEFFVSHGTADPILPIDRCSRLIVPQLQNRGYKVTFREFDGRHEVPPDVAIDAMKWVAAR
jgi:phospholipase/carboxylesterase